jgi:cyclophilin family peptidyl-prolyl cis-trans isomerase
MFDFGRSSKNSRRPAARSLRIESLETRQMLSATVGGAQELAEPNYAPAVTSQALENGPTLSPVDSRMIAVGAPLMISLQATDPSAGGVHYTIVDAGTFTAPAHVTIDIDQMSGVATITPEAGFTGAIMLRAGVRSATSAEEEGSYDFQSFTLDVSAPALSPFADPITQINTPTTISLTASDPLGHGVFYKIVDPATHAAPAHVTVTVEQTTGKVTFTPEAGFTGSIPLLAEVRSVDSPDDEANYTTQAFTLQVSSNVSLAPIEDVTLPGQKTVLVPLDGMSAGGESITYSFESSEPNVQVALVSPNSKSLVLNVSGVDKNGAAFSGRIVLHLFEDLAPQTTARIKELVTSGFYTGKTFHRVLDGFMAQGGGTSGQTLTDEFNPGLTFVSRGLLAMANAGPDTSDAQLFITALTAKGSDDPISLADMPQFLNFRFTIFGQLVEGFDIFQKLMTTPVEGKAIPSDPDDSAPKNTITITSASIIDDTQNAVLRVTANSNFTGSATITVTAHNAGTTAQQTFTATAGADTHVDPPFLGAIANQTATSGTPLTFALPVTNTSGRELTYEVVAPNGSAPTNVTVNVNAATGQVTLTPAAGFTGTVNLLARVKLKTPTSDTSNFDTQAFTLTVNASTATQPTLNAVSNQTTTVGTPATLTLSSNNPRSGTVEYSVVDPTTFGPPANVTVAVNQTSGQVTLTPGVGFTGTINLLARVRLSTAPDVQGSYDTKAFTLTVNQSSNIPAAPTGLAVASSSGGGAFDGGGYVTSLTPTLTLSAASGSTVQIKRGGTVIGTATETSTGSGQYRLTIPAGALAVGANSITAAASNNNGTGADSTAFSIVYAPDYSTGVYVVPGQPGTTQSLALAWTSKNASYKNEFGYAVVDSMDGAIGGVAPGEAAYAQALLSSATRQVIFSQGQSAGATTTVSLPAGKFVVFYLVQNNTTANFLAKNPTNSPRGNDDSKAPLAFFSLPAANPDGQRHTQIIADPMTGFVQYNWEDLYSLGDGDFNDAAITVRPATQTAQSPAGLRAPGMNRNDTLNASFVPGSKLSPSGDVGIYFVDDPSGKIGSLKPGDPGYAAAALAASNIAVLYSAGGGGSKQVSVAAGKYLGFYLITSGTTAGFLSSNSGNANGSSNALFSYDAANPDGGNHFRWVSPGQEAANSTLSQLHVMDKLGGSDRDFDAYAINLSFTA